ncbi:ESX secretion-associated protein EspG [Amycolatopsis sp. NPDC004079]|uniref:ESX secretion-associated protein EspG n=1 Tax=Amycolatopsis sp. NPDC004079 TaxID=3154549 RepID=UPI0033A7CC37
MKSCGLDGMHPVLVGDIRFTTDSTGAGMNEAVRGELAELGLLRGSRIADEFEEVLYTLARAEIEYVAHVVNQGERYGVLVAVRGRTCIAALCDGDRVLLKQPSPTRSAGYALATNLPDYRAAQVATFSLPQDEFRSDGGDGRYDTGERRPREALEIDALFRAPRYGLGEITLAARGRDGHRRAADGQLSYLDTASGRVAFEISGPPRNRYLTVMPGETELLAAKIDWLRAGLDDLKR